ncbi:MAG: hypothetical protein JW746_07375 [Candidatus Krumholzibacteriota bacterium]|nr:hypothetical protein [Candidatus Krumholzibacteriota bacterium]
MKKRLVIAGGKGSGQIAASVFEDANEVSGEWIIEGYLNDIVKPGELFGKYKVLGTSDEVADFVEKGYYLHYAFHFNSKNKFERVDKFQKLGIPLEANATAVHPAAFINPETKIGHGVVICAHAVTSFAPTIGNFVHVYSSSLLGHDCEIGDYSTIAAHSVVGARVAVSTGAHIGLNSSIREDVTIGEYAIVGMGSVVLNDVEDFGIAVGNPAKQIGTVQKYME